MLEVVCTIRSFDPVADTCSVELQGLGIIDSWLDGIAISQTVDRAYIVNGASGVIDMPDLHRICESTLIQVTPPGTPVAGDPDLIVVYNGYTDIPTDEFGNGCTDVLFPEPYSDTPLVTASSDSLLHLTLSHITETGFTACITGGKHNGHHSVAHSAKGHKSSTATSNKALTVYHDGDKVGTAYKLDFEDGAQITFAVAYDDLEKWNLVRAFITPDFLAMLEAGSSYHQRFIPGTAIDFLACPAPLDPPTITYGPGTGPEGDGEFRRYAVQYTTATRFGELGPPSPSISNTLEADVVVAAVPDGEPWLEVSGQQLWRETGDGTGIFYLHTTWADTAEHSFADTVPDSALITSYTPQPTAISLERSFYDTIHGVSTTNDSDLGIGGITRNGVKVGNHDRVPYLPDPATVKFLPCPPPQTTPALSGGSLATTLGTTVAPGVVTVTPGSMDGIYVGTSVAIGGDNPETVLVTAVTGTTFTATFALDHLASDPIGVNGPGPGDRQYMIVYHTAAGDSAKGPASRWIEGTTPTNIDIPAVPSTPAGVWDAVTGQALERTEAGGGGFRLLKDYPGDLGLQGYIDTTPDSALGADYTELPVTIKSLGGGGGGGGGGGPAGSAAALYGIGVDVSAPFGGTTYIPWDHLIVGDDIYLDPSNPDGLTIPPDGDGDYTLYVQLSRDGFPGAYDITVEHWSAGSMVFQVERTGYETGATNDAQTEISLPIPGTVAGDIVKVGLFPGSDSTVEAQDIDTWIGIAPAGTAAGTGARAALQVPVTASSTWISTANTNPPAMSLSDVNIPFDPPSANINTGPFTFDGTDTYVTVPAAGTYLIILTLEWVFDPDTALPLAMQGGTNIGVNLLQNDSTFLDRAHLRHNFLDGFIDTVRAQGGTYQGRIVLSAVSAFAAGDTINARLSVDSDWADWALNSYSRLNVIQQ